MTLRSQMILQETQAGSLIISSNPIGAIIYIDGFDTGLTTPATIGDMSIGTHIYQLSLSGYIDNTDSFDIAYDKITIVDTLLELIHRGNIAISSNPIGAKIYIDNLDTGLTTPATIGDILVGTHIYQLSLSGYIDNTGLFDIAHDKITIVDTLLELAYTGNLNISSNPIGARIYIDGLDTELITPSIIYNIYTGLYAYELELEGHRIYRNSVDIIQDQVAEVQINLVQITGSLYFSTNPEGATIFIDNLDTGLTTPATITDIPVGQHIYTLIMGNYSEYTGTINVLEGSITNIEDVLIPIEGCILFESSPSGAELIIEGMGRTFVTPVIVCDLPLGKLEYHLKLHGYKTFNGCITLVPDHGENISHNMVAKTNEEE